MSYKDSRKNDRFFQELQDYKKNILYQINDQR